MPRGRKKKDKKKIEEKQVVDKKEEKQLSLVAFDVFCSIKKVRNSHKAGMAAYKEAAKLLLNLADWEKHFEKY